MFFYLFSQPVMSQALSPQEWVQHVLSSQPSLDALRAEAEAQDVQSEGVVHPPPELQMSLSPLSLSPDSPLGVQAQLIQKLPLDLREQRNVVEIKTDIVMANQANQTLEIQRSALYDYTQWLEDCDKWSLSQAHEAILLKHRDAMNARTLSNKSQLALQLMMESKHAQQKQESLRWAGACEASTKQLQRWSPELDIQQMTPVVAWPNWADSPQEHPQIEALALQESRMEAQQAIWEKQKLPTPHLLGQVNTMNHMPDHHWMIGTRLTWTNPKKRRSEQAALSLNQQAIQAQQEDVNRQLLSVQQRSEAGLQALHQEYLWLENETLPRLKSEKEALLALFDSAQIPLASVIDVEHRLLAQRERQLEILAEAWREYADWSFATNTLFEEGSP